MMKTVLNIFVFAIVLATCNNLNAQNKSTLTQTIWGQVVDKETQATLPGVNTSDEQLAGYRIVEMDPGQ